jgi:hypothetical protein
MRRSTLNSGYRMSVVDSRRFHIRCMSAKRPSSDLQSKGPADPLRRYL